MLACQLSRAGSGPAPNVGELVKGSALQAPKLKQAVYRGLYTGTEALLTMHKHKHFTPLVLHALATSAWNEYETCVAGVKYRLNTSQIRRFA